MKLAACFLTLLPGFAVAASWTSPGFPAFSEQGTGTFVSHAQLPKGTRPLMLNFDQQCWQPADAIKLNQMLSLQPCSNTPPQWRLFRDGEYTLQLDTRSGTPTLMISLQNTVEPVASLVRECPKWDGLPLTLDVSATFAEGAAVRDYYSQQIAIVKNGQITLQPAATSNGLLLLERAETDTSAPFDWHNATVYFVLTDRFENGDPSNDQSYGRHKDGMAEIGTFHGGDLRGLTNKLDYLQQLGVNALWISAPFEQIHGWVGGGTKECRIGTNPLIVAIPSTPITMVDMSMSMFSYGMLEVNRLAGRQLPVDGGFDDEGNLTKEPGVIEKNRRILPMGYWKGSGMSIVLDMIATLLSDGASVAEVTEDNSDEYGISQIFIAIEVDKLIDGPTRDAKLQRIMDYVTSAERADENQAIRLPGHEFTTLLAENRRNGITVDDSVWAKIQAL